jgi:hypothetical protein
LDAVTSVASVKAKTEVGLPKFVSNLIVQWKEIHGDQKVSVHLMITV